MFGKTSRVNIYSKIIKFIYSHFNILHISIPPCQQGLCAKIEENEIVVPSCRTNGLEYAKRGYMQHSVLFRVLYATMPWCYVLPSANHAVPEGAMCTIFMIYKQILYHNYAQLQVNIKYISNRLYFMTATKNDKDIIHEILGLCA